MNQYQQEQISTVYIK